MIELTEEMREAFERAFEFVTSGDEVVINRRAIRAGLAAVLAIVERERCLQLRGHALVESTVKLRWICRRCGSPLAACLTCGEPSQCGDGFCAEHDTTDQDGRP